MIKTKNFYYKKINIYIFQILNNFYLNKNLVLKHILLFKIFFISFCLFFNVNKSYSKEIDKIISIVNKKVILKSDVERIISDKNFNFENYFNSESESLKNLVLNKLIIDEVIKNKLNEYETFFSSDLLFNVNQNIFLEKYINLNKKKKEITDKSILKLEPNNFLYWNIQYEKLKKKIYISEKEINYLSTILFLKNNNIKININHYILENPKIFSKKNIIEYKQIVNNLFKLLKNDKLSEKLIFKYLKNNKIVLGNFIGWNNLIKLPKYFRIFLFDLQKRKKIFGLFFLNKNLHLFQIKNIKYDKKIETEIKIKHILLIPSENRDENNTYFYLKQIKNQISSKEISFSNAAKKYSEDLYSALQGGEIDYDYKKIFDNFTLNKINKIKKGEITGPIRSLQGWHLVKLMNIKIVDNTYKIYKENAYKILFEKKLSEVIYNWLENEYNNSYINKICY
ncbi:surA [Wigglesworthia glossinidia endosymbiont of Glossina brevipalpis]|uniref:SurA protein n=1 Tax=Wigglesworthia glossinidia brevipalpis TaxID=36870 RepID=Q8D3I3_WIGBR|nr:surA [Wigglesworthia glossinidia endosymbiont of Glossina brevipalpis]